MTDCKQTESNRPEPRSEAHAPSHHAYDNPGLDAKGFLLAIMHDKDVPLHVRMDAAIKLAPYVAQEPIVSPRVSAIRGYVIPLLVLQ